MKLTVFSLEAAFSKQECAFPGSGRVGQLPGYKFTTRYPNAIELECIRIPSK